MERRNKKSSTRFIKTLSEQEQFELIYNDCMKFLEQNKEFIEWLDNEILKLETQN